MGGPALLHEGQRQAYQVGDAFRQRYLSACRGENGSATCLDASPAAEAGAVTQGRCGWARRLVRARPPAPACSARHGPGSPRTAWCTLGAHNLPALVPPARLTPRAVCDQARGTA